MSKWSVYLFPRNLDATQILQAMSKTESLDWYSVAIWNWCILVVSYFIHQLKEVTLSPLPDHPFLCPRILPPILPFQFPKHSSSYSSKTIQISSQASKFSSAYAPTFPNLSTLKNILRKMKHFEMLLAFFLLLGIIHPILGKECLGEFTCNEASTSKSNVHFCQL